MDWVSLCGADMVQAGSSPSGQCGWNGRGPVAVGERQLRLVRKGIV